MALELSIRIGAQRARVVATMFVLSTVAHTGFAQPTAATTPVTAATSARVFVPGGNVGFADYQQQVTLDLMDQARGWGAQGHAGDPDNHPARMDANGLPVATADIVIVNPDQRNSFPAGLYRGRHTGTARPSLVGGSGWTLENVKQQGDRWTYDLRATGNGLLWMRFDGALTSRPSILPDGVDPAKAPLLRPEVLANWSRYPLLRLMGLSQPLGSAEDEPTWASRLKPLEVKGGRKSWEWIFAVAAELHNAPGSRVKEVWISLPDRADMDYITRVAQMAKQVLPPTLKLGVSGANEGSWNWFYPQSKRLHEDSKNPAHPDFARIGGARADEWDRVARLYALRHARIAKVFKSVLGDQARPALEGHDLQASMVRDRMIPWLNQPSQVAEFGKFASYTHYLSMGGYVEGTTEQYAAAADGAALVACLRVGCKYALHHSEKVRGWKEWVAMARANGIASVYLYEWGPHVWGNDAIPKKLAAHRSPAMGQLVVEMANTFAAMGIDGGHFLGIHASRWRDDNVNTHWAAQEAYDVPTAKSQGLDELLRRR